MEEVDVVVIARHFEVLSKKIQELAVTGLIGTQNISVKFEKLVDRDLEETHGKIRKSTLGWLEYEMDTLNNIFSNMDALMKMITEYALFLDSNKWLGLRINLHSLDERRKLLEEMVENSEKMKKDVWDLVREENLLYEGDN